MITRDSCLGTSILGNFLTPVTVSQAEKLEMERVWGTAESVESIPKPEIMKLLAKLNLEVGSDFTSTILGDNAFQFYFVVGHFCENFGKGTCQSKPCV